MASKGATFLSQLKIAWDTHFQKNVQLILIISGSDPVGVESNILKNTGFFRRISLRIKLEELKLYLRA